MVLNPTAIVGDEELEHARGGPPRWGAASALFLTAASILVVGVGTIVSTAPTEREVEELLAVPEPIVVLVEAQPDQVLPEIRATEIPPELRGAVRWLPDLPPLEYGSE